MNIDNIADPVFTLPEMGENKILKEITDLATTTALQQHFLRDEENDTYFKVKNFSKSKQVTHRYGDIKERRIYRHRLCPLCRDEGAEGIRRRFKVIPKGLRNTIAEVVFLTLLKHREQHQQPSSSTHEQEQDNSELAKSMSLPKFENNNTSSSEKDLAYKTAIDVVHDYMDFSYTQIGRRVMVRNNYHQFRLENPILYHSSNRIDHYFHRGD